MVVRNMNSPDGSLRSSGPPGRFAADRELADKVLLTATSVAAAPRS